jgi:hypothetical protein
MSQSLAAIPYATETLEARPDQLLRRIVAWTAILYGGQAVLTTALHVALAKGWVASPNTMSWSFGGGADVLVTAARTLTNCALVTGGLFLLGRSRLGVILIRAGVAGAVVTAAAGLAVTLNAVPTYASYWSTPAAFAVNAADFLRGVALPVLLALLTLPALARRMT